MPSAPPSFYATERPDPGIQIQPDRLAPLSAVACPQCTGRHTTRTRRRTFLQKVVLFRLGYFPWKCLDCSHRFLAKDRGPSRAGHAHTLSSTDDR